MTEPVLHITFGDSGGGSLREVVKNADRQDEVAIFIDALNFGPIEYSDAREREAWVEDNLGFGDFERIAHSSELFWTKVLSDKKPKVLWTSRRSGVDYTGFLECLWRLGNALCSVVDLTETVVTNPRNGTKSLALCLGMLNQQEILESGFFEMGVPITPQLRGNYHDIWNHLRKENAPFRIVGSDGIVSAPIDHFDDFLVSCVTDEWQKSARVIGEAIGRETMTNTKSF